MQITADNVQGNLTTVGSPIVLQRRGSVYGANVPMITGNGKDAIKPRRITFLRVQYRFIKNEDC